MCRQKQTMLNEISVQCPVKLTKNVNATHRTTCDSNFWLAGNQQAISIDSLRANQC